MILSKKLFKEYGYIYSIFSIIKYVSFQLLKTLFNRKKTSNIISNDFFDVSRAKGKPYLVANDNDDLKCISCNLCSEICVSNCIAIEKGNKEFDPPAKFELNLLRCTLCGLCAEVCPVDAIKMSTRYTLANFKEKNWNLGISDLKDINS